MPPKGWRKYADGFRPVNSSGQPLREKENYSIDDLLLPKTTVTKLAKQVIPDDSQIPKDGVTALLRSATVFINYLSSSANKSAHDNCRKIIKPQDVYKGLENISLGAFIPLVQEELEKYEQYRQDKKNTNIPEEVSDDEEKDEEIEKRSKLHVDSTTISEQTPNTETEWESQDTSPSNEKQNQLESNINEQEINDGSDTEQIQSKQMEISEDQVEDLGNTVPAESENEEEDDEETCRFRNK